jgi:hypothetical protein
MSGLSTVGRGICQGTLALCSGASKVAKGGANVVVGTGKGAMKVAMFVTIPKSLPGTFAAGAAGWYARQQAFLHAPRVLSKICIQLTTRAVGNAALGKFIAETMVIPAVVPPLVPLAAKAVGIAALLAATGVCNGIYQASKGSAPKKQSQPEDIDAIINEFHHVTDTPEAEAEDDDAIMNEFQHLAPKPIHIPGPEALLPLRAAAPAA